MRVGVSILGARTVALATLIVGASWTVVGQAAPPSVPMLMTEQGRLTDSTGAPITVKTNLTFKIYTVATAGVSKWTEKQSVTPAEGYFSLELGSVTALPLTLFTGVDLYLGVTVGTDPEMTPRQHITTVPYAFVSDNAIGDITPNSVTTTGAIAGGTGTFTGVLAANGGVSVGGTTIIDGSGNWVGAPPMASPIVGWAQFTGFSGYYPYYVYTYLPTGGGTLTMTAGNFTPSFSGTCIVEMSWQPRYGAPVAGDYSYAYPAINGSNTGAYCYTQYGAGPDFAAPTCATSAQFSVTSGTNYTVGCYAYTTSGWGGGDPYCVVAWTCTP